MKQIKLGNFINKYTLAFFAFTIPVLIYLHYDFNKFAKYDIDDKMGMFQSELKNVLTFYNDILDIKIGEISNREDVKNAVRLATSENLALQHDELKRILGSDYNMLHELGITLLHIHTKDKRSLIRFHAPEFYGDDLKGARYAISLSQDKQKAVSGYEVGKYFNGYRLIKPIIDKGETIGSIEASIPFENILKKLNSVSPSFYEVIIKKDILDKTYKLNNLHPSTISDEYINYKIAVNSIENIAKLPELDAILKEKGVNLDKNSDFVEHIFDENLYYYTVLFKHIRNTEGESMGYIMKYQKNYYYFQILAEHIIKGVIFTIFVLAVLYLMHKREKYQGLLLQYKEAVDMSNIVSKTDASGVIKFVNHKFCEISGYSPDELIGKPHSIVRHPDMPKEAFADLWSTIKSGKVWRGVVKNKKKDGSAYIVDALIVPIMNEDGEAIEYIGIRHDITELENYKEIIEKQLADKSEGLKEKINLIKEYEKTIDASTACSRTNKNGVIIYVNDKFCKMSGYSKDELLGKKHNIIKHPDNNPQIFKELWVNLLNLKTWRGVLKNRNKDGGEYYVDITISPILDTSGKVVEYMSISHDITEISKLNQEIFETQKELLLTVGTVGEFRSKETGMHVKRVAEYSYQLAKLAGLTEKECLMLKTASPLHDIGKIAIPDHILHKPAKLTEDEFAIIKNHSKLGYEILKVSERPLIKTAALISKEHHERWDGKGYPDGLKEDEIHIFGRIVGLVDVFDALSSERVYKKAWAIEDILAYIIDERGKQFDPILVDIFLKNIKLFVDIKERYKDVEPEV